MSQPIGMMDVTKEARKNLPQAHMDQKSRTR
jgi:hypothetical protein